MHFATWLFNEEIDDLRNTYADLIDFLSNSKEDLYVNFSDTPRDDMKLSLKAFHHDPIGIYGFGKKYMLDEKKMNQGFWSKPYITVFKIQDDAKVLNLSTLSVDEAKSILRKMEIEDWIDKPYYREVDKSKGGALLWNTMEKYISSENLHKNTAWNKLFSMAGDFDAIRDEGSGFIHFAEPDQIIVLKPSVIQVVMKKELPAIDYNKKIWSGLYKLVTNLGNRYLGKYKIKSSKSGSIELYGGKKDILAKPHTLAGHRLFQISAESLDLNKPFLISAEYEISQAKLYVSIQDFAGNYEKIFEKKFEGKYDMGMTIVKNIDWDQLNKEIETLMDTKVAGSSKPKEIDDLQTLHREITKKLNLPNAKTRISVADKDVSSYTQLMVSGIPVVINIKASFGSSYDKKQKTSVYLIVRNKTSNLYRRSSLPTFTDMVEMESTPNKISADEVVRRFKQKMQESLEKSQKDSNSYLYDDVIKVLKFMLESMFKA